MVYQINESTCVRCGACVGNCPISAIEQKEDKYTINPNKCKGCGVCESTCPISAISEK
jgi:MinD superfamily P-loop ATPase